jgi:lysophospholipase-3
MYTFLEAAGYVRNVNIRVAGYDSRLTPDLGGFMGRTVALIEETYRQNGDTPVHLVGHSNGPLYAQYLLTHTSQAWKNQYIHGFTPIAGNWAGAGGVIWLDFTGANLNTPDASLPTDPENAASSAAMFQSFPTTYMSSADPEVFKKQVVVIGVAEGKQYTPQHYRQLFRDAGMPVARELAAHYVGLVKFATPKYFPNVDVYAEKGSGLPTLVGVELQELKVATFESNVSDFFLRDGDGNQEDITNDAIKDVWTAMRCYRFEFQDNPGVDHLSLAVNPAVLERLLTHLQQPRSVCSSD